LGAVDGPTPPEVCVGVAVGEPLEVGGLVVGDDGGVVEGLVGGLVGGAGVEEVMIDGSGLALVEGVGLQLADGDGPALRVLPPVVPAVGKFCPEPVLVPPLRPPLPEWCVWPDENADCAAEITCCGSPAERAKPPAAPITAAAPKASADRSFSCRDMPDPGRSALPAPSRASTAGRSLSPAASRYLATRRSHELSRVG
jgi:hypothetical protein